jgi:hypothetical protein
MDNFYDNLDDDFDDNFSDDFNDDSIEDAFDDDFGPEDSLDDDIGIEVEPAGDDMCEDDITMEDAVFIGGAIMGWGYEEGLLEAERRRLEKKMDDDQNDHFRKED